MERLEIRRPQDLGLAVSEARRRRGLTQTELAEQSGLERTYLAKLESGLNTLLIERSVRLLRRLGARIIVELPDDPRAEPADEPPTGTEREGQ